jgi:pyruvate/2-oxoglutarate dehydrogenase complex dihydrolipoamide acyltransferase (E2) component
VVDVLFPALSQREPGAEGVLSTWFVADGDEVADGQLIGEVMVDKVAGEVIAPTAGRVHLLIAEEAAAHQGEVIATVE